MSMLLEENPYRAPEARVEDAPTTESTQKFYVVSPRKFLILMIGTMNLYQLYWFYKHWSKLNFPQQTYWPVPRAIFSYFFTHSLFTEIDHALILRGADYRWSPTSLANVFVVCAIVSAIASEIGNAIARGTPYRGASVTFLIVGFVLIVPKVWSLYRAQLAANIADGDAAGATNNSITGWNIGWLIFGGAMWAFSALGWFAMATGRDLG